MLRNAANGDRTELLRYSPALSIQSVIAVTFEQSSPARTHARGSTHVNCCNFCGREHLGRSQGVCAPLVYKHHHTLAHHPQHLAKATQIFAATRTRTQFIVSSIHGYIHVM